MSNVASDLVSATITEMSHLLRQREVSPVELTAATLERIAALQSRLLCFTTVTPEYAMQRARDAERDIARGMYRGLLHGIPYTLKDVIATQGIRTTFGNPKGVDYRPTASATVHTLLEEAGGILVGKVVSEIGRGTTGPVGCLTRGTSRAALGPPAVARGQPLPRRWDWPRSALTRAGRCGTRLSSKGFFS